LCYVLGHTFAIWEVQKNIMKSAHQKGKNIPKNKIAHIANP
jgi:hypothetical protein